MTTDFVQIERHGPVALLRLNRPEARNAMNVALSAATVEAIAACQDAHAIVLTGNGPAFCAGLDLRDLGVAELADLPPFNQAARDSLVPMIAAVNGAAVTGGFELALACDFMVGTPRARFADTHLRVKVYPGPVLIDLPRRVGMARAREMSLTGNFVDADTALRIGLLNHVVAEEQLIPFCLELAQAIAEQDPAMVRAMRADWNANDALPVEEAHRAHMRFAGEAGFRNARNDTLTSNMDAVIARARRQAVDGPFPGA